MFFFIRQGSSQILTMTQKKGLPIQGSLADTAIHCREEERQISKNLYTPSIVPKRKEQPQHWLDSWCTLGGGGTGFAYRSPVSTPYRLSVSFSSANSSPRCSVIFFLSLGHMTVTVCTSLCTVWLHIPCTLPVTVSPISPTGFNVAESYFLTT